MFPAKTHQSARFRGLACVLASVFAVVVTVSYSSAQHQTDSASPDLSIYMKRSKMRSSASAGELSRLVAVKTAGDIGATVSETGGALRHQIGNLEGWYLLEYASVEAASAAAETLPTMEGVEEAVQQRMRQRIKKTNDTFYSDMWHLLNTAGNSGAAGNDVNIETAWGTATGNGVTLAILDDGVDMTHPDLAANLSTNTLHFDYIDNDADANPDLVDDDHGTACAGLAGALANNNLGVAGSAYDCNLVAVRMLGTTTDAQDASALGHSTGVIDIYSNSWGRSEYFNDGPLALDAINDGVANGRGGLGCIYVFAGGNDADVNEDTNTDSILIPAGVIVVGGLSADGEVVTYSEPGENMTIVAPAGEFGNIFTADRQGAAGYNDGATGGEPADSDYTGTFSGTSAACPIAAGVVALMLETNPNLTWRDVQHILQDTSEFVDPTDASWGTNAAGVRFSRYYGFGRIDATAAVNAANGWINVDAQVQSALVTDNTGVAIPDDNNAWISRSLNVGETIQIEHVMLEIESDHTAWTDFDIELESPNGTISPIQFSNNNASAPGADGNPGANHWTYRSNRFWDETSDGMWTLRIRDTQGGDTGTLTDWSLQIFGTQETPPSITNVSPNPMVAGDTVTITGTDLVGSTVTIGGVNQGASDSGNDLVFTVAANTPTGTQTLTVANAVGDDTAGVNVLLPPSPPAITNINPSSIRLGEPAMIVGTDLVGGTVRLGGSVIASTANGGNLVITIPYGSTVGANTISVQNGAGTDTFNVTIQDNPEPAIFLVNDSSPEVASELVIDGWRLTGATVTIGGFAQTITSNNGGEVRLTIAAGTPAGNVTLEIVTASGSVTDQLQVEVPPVLLPNITQLSTLNVIRGSTVTIEGTALANATVTVGLQSQTVLSNTDTEIEIRVSSSTNLGSTVLEVVTLYGSQLQNITILAGGAAVGGGSGGGGGGGCSVATGTSTSLALLVIGCVAMLSFRRREEEIV